MDQDQDLDLDGVPASLDVPAAREESPVLGNVAKQDSQVYVGV